MKVTKYLATLLIGLFIASTLNAQPGPQGKRKNWDDQPGPYHERMMDKLDLTDDQKAELQKIHTANLKEAIPIRNQIDEKKAQLKTLETAEKADLGQINKKIDEISVLKTKLAKMRAEGKQKIRALLTEEQRVKFDAHQGFAKRKGREPGQHGKCWRDQ